MDLAQLEPENPARVEAAGEAGHEALQRVAVAVRGGEEEEEVVFEGAAEDAQGEEGGGGWGERVEVVIGGVKEVGCWVDGGGAGAWFVFVADSGAGDAGEVEEPREASGEVGGHEPRVELVDGGLYCVVGAEDGFRVVDHDLLTERDAVVVVLIYFDEFRRRACFKG